MDTYNSYMELKPILKIILRNSIQSVCYRPKRSN